MKHHCDAFFLAKVICVCLLAPTLQAVSFSPSDTAHKYYLATNPANGDLYISLPLRRQIWKVRDAYGLPTTPSANYEVIAGTGQSCIYGESCGDGGPATMATLAFPKGTLFYVLL